MVSSFNDFNMHAWSTSMLLLLQSAFMLSMVNLLLKGEVGGHVDHGKILELCFLISVGTLQYDAWYFDVLYHTRLQFLSVDEVSGI